MQVRHLKEKNLHYMKDTGLYFQLTHSRPLSTDYHDHDFYEIVVILDGACFHKVDDNVMHMKRGQGCFLRPQQYHILYDQEPGTNVASFSISCEIMEKFFEAYGVDELDQNMWLDLDELEHFSEMCERADTLNSIRMLRSIIGMLVADFIQGSEIYRERIPESFSEVLKEMQKPEMIAGGMQSFFKLSSFSYPHLCRLTKRYLNVTPGEYITALRLKYAYELIAYGNESYETICEICGFSSFSHFCKLIRNKYGKTPAKIRQQARTQVNTI